jgi:oligopeptide transport system substrate-binding protein
VAFSFFNMQTSLRLLGLLVLASLLGSCHKTEGAVASGNRDQIIHIGNLSEPVDLDPQIINVQQDFNIVQALFEGLAQFDPQSCKPVPGVAERWEVSADNLTWTFHLRGNAIWSDGDPVTARDFIYSYQRILSPKLASPQAYLLFGIRGAEQFNAGKLTDFAQVGVSAPDDRTLVLSLNHPVPYLPTMVCNQAWYPVHRQTIEKFGKMDDRGTAWTRPENLVGNGYFLLSEWRPHQFIRLTKSPTYWDRDQVKLKEAFFYPIESEDAEERTFRAGQLHVTSTLPISKISVYEKEHSASYHPHVFLGTFFLRFNVAKGPLGDARVRRALSLAIDRERFVRDVLHGHQQPAGTLTPPDTAGFTAQGNPPYDLTTAKKLLAEAGFPDGKDFPHLEFLFNTTEANRAIGEALQQMWRTGLGVDITLQNQEAKVQTESMRTGNYEIGRYAWIGDYLDPSTFLEMMITGGGNNQTGWSNAEYDRLIADANQTADNAKRYAAYQRCEQILATECPIAPIYFYVRNNLVRPEVKGWYGNLLDAHALKGVYLDPAAAK